MTPCSVDGCDRPVRYIKSGLCSLHYQRQRKTGDPLGLRNLPADPTVRFWSKVDKTETCWLWTGATDRAGYGRFQAGSDRATSRNVLAHVYAWTITHGPVPEGHELDHVCRVRFCVRPDPDHLEPVTHAENIRRGEWGMHTAAKKARTHCKHGHELAGDNLIITPKQRRCRTCKNASERARIQRRADVRAVPEEQPPG